MNKLKLRQLLLLIILVFVFVLVVFEVYVYGTMYALIAQTRREYADSFIGQFEKTAIQFHNEVQTAAISISYNTATQEFLLTENVYERQQYEKVMLDMTIVLKLSSNIGSIIFLDAASQPVTAMDNQEYGIVQELRSRYGLRAADLTEPCYSEVIAYTPAGSNAEEARSFAYLFPIKGIISKEEPLFSTIGTCIILVKPSSVAEMMQSLARADGSSLAVVSQADRVLAMVGSLDSAPSEETIQLNRRIEAGQENGSTVEYQGQQCLLNYRTIDALGWNIISLIPLQSISRDLSFIQNISLGSVLMFSVLGILCLMGFYRSVSTSIGKITGFMERISAGENSLRLSTGSENEIGLLAKGINKMLDDIAAANDRILAANTQRMHAELAQRNAQLMALQSQINPHFLYNTLDCIRSIALSHRIMDIVNISTGMADIFRYSIQWDTCSSVRQELFIVQNYLGIISIRYGAQIELKIAVHPSLLDCEVPRMILQPIVENAVSHAFAGRKANGIITIEGIRAEAGGIRLTVSDNGVGMKPDALRKLTAHFEGSALPLTNAATGKPELGSSGAWDDRESIGLTNIHHRIRLFMGEGYGLTVESTPGVGTGVSLLLADIQRTRAAHERAPEDD